MISPFLSCSPLSLLKVKEKQSSPDPGSDDLSDFSRFPLKQTHLHSRGFFPPLLPCTDKDVKLGKLLKEARVKHPPFPLKGKGGCNSREERAFF